jgi:NitT/TauT family transport system substrate-binding protein
VKADGGRAPVGPRGGRLKSLACVAVAGWLAACSAPPATTTLEPVRLAIGSYLTDAMSFIAHEQGIFAAHGLDVELVVLNRAGAALPALSGGEIDAASSGLLNPRVFNIIQRGGNLRLVAARTFYDAQGCAHEAFVVRARLLDSGRVTDAASLRGLRVTTERTGSNYYYFGRLLAQGGLTLDDVEMVDMPVPSRGDAFAKEMIDVATASEPWATRITRDPGVRIWKRVAEVLPDRHSSFLVFGERLLGPRRDLGRRFLAAYLEAARRLREEGKSPRNVEAIARWTRLPPAELRAMCWPAPPSDPRPDARTLEEYQTWALANGLIDDISRYETLVDLGFLDALGAAPPSGGGGD